jgi:hypothetical protein
MKEREKMKGFVSLRAFVFIVMILLLSCGSYALGLSPSGKTVQFYSGEVVNFTFNVVNGEGADINVTLSSYGDLKDSVFFENQTLHLYPSAYMTSFKVALMMPRELSPGIHTAYVRVTPDFNSAGDMFRAYVSPIMPINVRVPFPNKYAEVSIDVLPVDEGTPVPINLVFDNLGNQNIASAGGTIEVFGPEGELVERLVSPSISVPANTFAKSEGAPIRVLPKGQYMAVGEAYYDSVKISLSDNFTLGEPDISIISVSAKPIPAGRISPVAFKVRLDWNAPLAMKYFTAIGGFEKEMPLVTLKQGVETELAGLADASRLESGRYDLEIKMIYGSTLKSRKFQITVSEPSAVQRVASSGLTAVLIIAIALILVIVAIVLYMRRRKKGGDGGAKPLNSPSISGE